MDIVQITDRILVSIGIGMSAAFHLFRFSIMTLMPAIEDIKTDVMCEGLSLKRGLIITVGILVSISHKITLRLVCICFFNKIFPLSFTDIFVVISIVYLFL